MTESSPYRDTPSTDAPPTAHVCVECDHYRRYLIFGSDEDHECAATARVIPQQLVRVSRVTGKPVYRKAMHIRKTCAEHRHSKSGGISDFCPDFIPKEPTWLHRVWAWLRGTR